MFAPNLQSPPSFLALWYLGAHLLLPKVTVVSWDIHHPRILSYPQLVELSKGEGHIGLMTASTQAPSICRALCKHYLHESSHSP